MKRQPERPIFKLYSKGFQSNQSDTIFSIIGSSEPDLTKSLAFLLHYSPIYLKHVLSMIDVQIDLKYNKALIGAEQKPDKPSGAIRRDISIILRYQNPKKDTIIVIEAKHLSVGNIKIGGIATQLAQYIDPRRYSDVSTIPRKIGVTLTKDRLYFDTRSSGGFDEIKSITWQNIIQSLTTIGADDYLLTSFNQQLMKSNSRKTYEQEVFCPPVGDSFNKVKKLNIYCCPPDRNLQEAIYLMPRIPVNGHEKDIAGILNI